MSDPITKKKILKLPEPFDDFDRRYLSLTYGPNAEYLTLVENNFANYIEGVYSTIRQNATFSYSTKGISPVQVRGQKMNILQSQILVEGEGTKNIDNKFVILSREPFLPGSVTLDIAGGIPQLYGFDFVVSGNVLSWNGLGLDNLLEVGDTLIIRL